MADLDLAELRRLAEAATAGPWVWQGRRIDVAGLSSAVLQRLQSPGRPDCFRSPCDWGSCIATNDDGTFDLSEHACTSCRSKWHQWHGSSSAGHPDAAYLNAALPAVVLQLLDRLEAAEARVEEALGILGSLVEEEPCSFDHHGYCQAHGWFYDDERCANARGAELLARPVPGAVAGEPGGEQQ